MEISSLLPFILIALVAFVVLKMIVGAIKSSAKLMLWATVAVVAFGACFLWYQSQTGASSSLPTLSIPSAPSAGE